MRGKFIVIEGTDGSGKTTQKQELLKRLNLTDIQAKTIKFPDYNSKTGDIIARYLGKPPYNKPQFGPSNDVCPMIASTWYALDRFAHKQEIESALNSGVWIIADRYVESNMGHQGGKVLGLLENLKEQKPMTQSQFEIAQRIQRLGGFKGFINWLNDLEYGHFELPKPDLVLYFHRNPQVGENLITKRAELKDGHEASEEHMTNSEKAYEKISQMLNWTRIECSPNNTMRSIEDIADETWAHIQKILSH